jgi:hypothetical protein
MTAGFGGAETAAPDVAPFGAEQAQNTIAAAMLAAIRIDMGGPFTLAIRRSRFQRSRQLDAQAYT